MTWFTRLKDRLIERRVSHAAKILRRHRGHHKHILRDD